MCSWLSYWASRNHSVSIYTYIHTGTHVRTQKGTPDLWIFGVFCSWTQLQINWKWEKESKSLTTVKNWSQAAGLLGHREVFICEKPTKPKAGVCLWCVCVLCFLEEPQWRRIHFEEGSLGQGYNVLLGFVLL